MKNKSIIVSILIVGVLVFSAGAVSARPIVLKIGSPTPKGSPWDNAIREMAAEWADITEGQVRMKIYSGGIAGNEADIIRKMKFNSLQGGVFTSLGLNQMYPDVIALNSPFLMESEGEFHYVFKNVEEDLKKDIEDQGFKIVTWTEVGWLNIFARSKVVTIDDLRKMKLATTDSDAGIVQAFKALNINAVPLGYQEIMTSLSSGLVDACYNSRVGAAAYQWFGVANHMVDLPMAPLLAGIVISKRAWDAIPDRYKDDMIQAAEGVSRKLESETETLEAQAMRVMLDNGLQVHDVPPSAEAEWRREFREGLDFVAGDSYSVDFFDKIIRLIEAYRNGSIVRQ